VVPSTISYQKGVETQVKRAGLAQSEKAMKRYVIEEETLLKLHAV
jgi:hypothetical protein